MIHVMSHFSRIYIRFNGKEDLYSSIHLFMSALAGIWLLGLTFLAACIWSIDRVPSSVLIGLFFLPMICLSWLPRYLKSINYASSVTQGDFVKSVIYVSLLFIGSVIATVTAGANCT